MFTGSGMSRAEIRAALHRLQNGRCAVCPSTGKLHVDHDHATGLVRGLLCRPCNIREGQHGDHADLDAYRANPPAAGLGWLWELPDMWTEEDTANVERLGITIVEYLPQYLELAAARKQVLQQQALAAMLDSKWGRASS
jgi:Recombination endonuclease VII